MNLSRAAAFAFCLFGCVAASPVPVSVTIDRDDYGVPHIYAATEEAGYYGLGYAMSEDRFDRLMQLLLYARGELASTAGPSMLEADIQNRLWRNHEMAAAAVGQLSPQLHRNYAAFAAGIRAYAADAKVKPEQAALANSLTVADMVAIPRAIVYAGYHEQFAQVECGVNGMTYSRGMLPYRSTEKAPASNGWVVMPSRTAAGALILASDPHVDTNNIAYYEYEMQAGNLHAAGYAMGPALWQSHTEGVAWAMTTGNPDFLDCYAIETEPANPRRYLYNGKPEEMEVRKETIAVAGAPSVTRAFEYARMNGLLAPVIARRDGKAYVASAADMDRAGYLNEEYYRMSKAQSADELKQALATMSGMPQNITAGDRAGHVLYIRVGRAPIRPAGYDFTKPVPGNSAKTAWLGFHSIDDLVQLRDPRAGYLQNDNASPDVVTPIDGVNAKDYPPDIYFDLPGRQTTRGARALQVLGAHPRMTLDDAFGLAFDEMWITAPGWIDALRYATQARPDLVTAASPATRLALNRILGFDGQAHAESEAAVDFYFWRAAANGPVAKLQNGAFIDWPWKVEHFDRELATTLLTALAQSVETRHAAYGDRTLKLGDLVRVTRGEVDLPVGGVTIDSTAVPLCVEMFRAICERTPRAFGVVPFGKDGRFMVIRGSQAMRLVEFTKPLRAYSLYAFGQSDDPKSPHYADQVRLFSEKKMKPAYFSKAELAGHISAMETLTLPADIETPQ
ncbi:MAG TPA: penicillin acylase family protein [Rhizomicrobium sp.]|jgi:acyl-homoserine-lactone acylase